MQVFYITELIDTIGISNSTAYSFFSGLTRQKHGSVKDRYKCCNYCNLLTITCQSGLSNLLAQVNRRSIIEGKTIEAAILLFTLQRPLKYYAPKALLIAVGQKTKTIFSFYISYIHFLIKLFIPIYPKAEIGLFYIHIWTKKLIKP